MARKSAPERLFDPDPEGIRAVARVRKGVDATLTALRTGGRLEPVDAAFVALARTVADAIDAEHTAAEPSRFTVGALAGRLHPILVELRGGVAADRDTGADVDAAFAQLSAAIRDATPP